MLKMQNNYFKQDFDLFLNQYNTARQTYYCSHGIGGGQSWSSQGTDKGNKLMKRRRCKASDNSDVDINEVSLTITNACQRLNILKQQSANDSKNDELMSYMQDASAIHSQLQELKARIRNKTGLIKAQVIKVRKKRASRKLRRDNERLLASSLSENNKKRNESEINELLEIKLNEDKVRRDEELKKEADVVMRDVRKKIKDVRKCQERVLSIERLRKVLKESAERRSLFTTSECDHTFNRKINQIKDLIEQRIALYKRKENTLEEMIKNNEAKDNERQMKLNEENVCEKISQKRSSLEIAMFGSIKYPDLNSLESFRNWQYYEQAHHNIGNMMRIRHGWDQYLSDDGQSIPITYVFPPQTSDERWQKYIIDP